MPHADQPSYAELAAQVAAPRIGHVPSSRVPVAGAAAAQGHDIPPAACFPRGPCGGRALAWQCPGPGDRGNPGESILESGKPAFCAKRHDHGRHGVRQAMSSTTEAGNAMSPRIGPLAAAAGVAAAAIAGGGYALASGGHLAGVTAKPTFECIKIADPKVYYFET